VDKLRFAITDEAGLAYSALWTVAPGTNRRKPDVYVTAWGFQGAAKFSFHADVLNHSWLAEAHPGLIERGVVPAGAPRRQAQVPIGPLPWHGLTVRIPFETLAKKGQSLEHVKGSVVALPPPKEGMALEIGFFLAVGDALEINGAQFGIGQVASGGRALVVVGAYRPFEGAAFKQALKATLERTAVPTNVAQSVGPEDNLAMHLFGQENGVMIVTEVHNVRFVPPSKNAAS